MRSIRHHIIDLAISDFKLIFRESSLRIFLLMPAMFFVVILWFLPYLINQYQVVQDYVPYVLMAATFQTSTMFGFIYCMVLIDEKDTGVNKVYGILPISKSTFITLRLFFPWVFALAITFLLLELQPFYTVPRSYNLLISMLTALMGPFFTLLITNLSKNKIEGMTYYKGINGLLNLPLLAFFIPETYSFAFGFIPSHWVFQEINFFILEKQLYINMSIGYVVSIGMLLLLVRHFSKRHFG